MFRVVANPKYRVALILAVLSWFGPVTVAFMPGASAAQAGDLKKEIEAKIVAVQQGAAPKLKVGPATCPAKLAGVQKRVPIGTYTCTVQIEGVSAPYTVVVSEGGFLKGGVYKIAPAKAIIDLTKVVGFVRASLDEKEAVEAKIVCGKGVVAVLEPNSTIICTVTVGGSPQNYTFVVKDVNGTIAIRTPSGSTATSAPGSAGKSTAPSTTTKVGRSTVSSTTKKA